MGNINSRTAGTRRHLPGVSIRRFAVVAPSGLVPATPAKPSSYGRFCLVIFDYRPIVPFAGPLTNCAVAAVGYPERRVAHSPTSAAVSPKHTHRGYSA